jgi:hypothetical protein
MRGSNEGIGGLANGEWQHRRVLTRAGKILPIYRRMRSVAIGADRPSTRSKTLSDHYGSASVGRTKAPACRRGARCWPSRQRAVYGRRPHLRKPQSFFSDYERGQRPVDLMEFLAIARGLNADPQEIFRAIVHSASEYLTEMSLNGNNWGALTPSQCWSRRPARQPSPPLVPAVPWYPNG